MGAFVRRLDRWRAWGARSHARGIFAAMVVVGLSTVGVRVLSTGRELVAAREFGVGDAMDAFFIAYMLPLFLVGVLGASVSAALIPVYSEVREREGLDAARRLVATVTAWSFVVLLVACAVIAVVFPLALPVLALGFDPAKRELTQTLFFLLLPVIVLNGLSAVWSAVLNAGRRFALAAATPAISPAATIAVILLMADRWGVYAIPAGIVGGTLVEAALLGATLARRDLAVRPRLRSLDPATRMVMRQYVPTSAGASIMGTTLIVDQAMAAALGAGSVAALNYGGRIVSFFLGIAAMAVSTAVLPFFSDMVTARDWTGVRRTLRVYVRLIVLASLPLVAFLWFLSEPTVALLFEAGAFTAEDTELVARIQRLFALQLPFYLSAILAVRVISSLRANVVLVWASILNVVVNIALNLLFIRWLGVAGIALSTSVVYAGSFAFVRIAVARRLARAEAGG